MNAPTRLPMRWTGKNQPTLLQQAMAGVLETRPLEKNETGPLIFAAIETQDMLPFLVAAKSLRWQLGRGKFAVMDRGSLSGEDKALLAHHCADPLILVSRADNAPFPDTRWWDWIAPVIGRFHMEYRILLDLRRVTLDPSQDMLGAISRNRGFVGPDTEGLMGIPAMSGGIAEAQDLLERLPAGCLSASDTPYRLVRDLIFEGTGTVLLDEPEGQEMDVAAVRRTIDTLAN